MRTRAVVGIVLTAFVLAATGCSAGDPGVTATRSAGTTAPPGSTTTPSGPPTTTAPGETTTTAPAEPDEPIDQDPDVRVLTLENGLRVYLRDNQRPGRHAELRLAINAGSADEDADQAGVAHFLEHMLFNGTAEFPANELIATLRKFGMQLGADINAYTSFDETVYSLSVPLDDPDNLEIGLDVLTQWLSAATLSDEEVTKERGVVLDEWRQREQSLDGRIGDAILEMFLAGTAYDGRAPIGNQAAIESMTPDVLRRFYDQWYRPDNAAIIVVGDIDVDEVEAAIRSRVETLTPRGGDGPHPVAALAGYDTPLARVLVDPDQADAALELTLPVPVEPGRPATTGSTRHQILLGLAFDMISTRFRDDISRGLAPFTSTFVSNNDIVRAMDAPSVVVRGEAGSLDASITALLSEFERARRFGFDDGELKRAVAGVRSAADSAYERRDTVQDAEYTDRYVSHFLEAAAIPPAETEHDLVGGILDGATPAAVAAVFIERFSAAAPHLLVAVPDTVTGPPTADDLLARIAALPDLELQPREATTGPDGGLMTAPDPVEEVERPALDADPFSFVDPVQLLFANGARVILNSTPIVDQAVALSAISPGGLSLVDDADVPEALIVVDVIAGSGVGDLDPVQLDTVLGATSVQVSPYLDQTVEGFQGSSSTADLESVFQLLHLYLERPRFEQAGLDAAIGSIRPLAEDPTSNPDFATYLAYTEARYGGEPRFLPAPAAADLDSLDLAAVERVWRTRFSNAGDWTFAFSGDFEMDAVIDFARRYIGSLTGTGATETFVDRQPDPPPGVVERVVRAGTGDKATLTIVATAPTGDPESARVVCDVLSSVLTTRLTDHIREALGASYSPNAFCSVEAEPDALVTTVVQVSGDPAGIDQLLTIVLGDIDALRTDGPSDTEFDAALADLSDQYDLFSNELLLSVLVRAPQHGQELQAFIDRRATLADVSQGDVTAFIGAALPAGQYIEITTIPA